MANTLMFEVGVKEAGTQLKDLEERLKNLTSTYGKMELNVDFKSSEDLKTFVNALRMLGDGKVLDPLLKRIEQLQVSMVRLGMIPNDINYTALEQQLNKLSEAYKNLDKARGTSAETARQQAANLLKSNIEKEFGMPVNVLNAVMDTYKNMGNTIQENLSKVASSVSTSTKQSNTALEQESSAVTETVQKLNALVAEKQQVVNAEKQLAGSSANTANSVANEGKQAKATSDALDTVSQSNKKAGDQAAKTGQQIDTLSNKYLNLASSIENRLANQSKLLESGSSHYDAQLRQSIKGYQSLYEEVKKAISSNAGADVFGNLKTMLSGLDIAFSNVNREAQAFRRTLDQRSRAEERQISAGLKAEERVGKARVRERERQEKQYEQIWQKGLRDRETAAQKAARTEAKSAQDASVEYTRLQGVLERLTQLRSNAVGAKVDTAEIDVLISKIKTLQTLYSEIALGNGRSASGLLFGDLKGNPNTRSTMLEIGQVFTETNNHIRENNRLSRESEKESRAKAAAEVRANKDVQNEIDRTKAKIEELNAAIARGRNAGRDMSVLESQRIRLEGQKMLLENLTAADKADRAGLDKRLDNVKALRDESVRLLKTENELTKTREQANKANDRKAIKNLQDEEKSVNDAYIKYNKLTAKILEMEALLARGQKANIDTTPVEKYIEYLNRLRTLMDEIRSNKGRTINSSATNSFYLSQGMLTSQVLGHNNTRMPVEEYSLKVFKKDLKETEAQIAKSESYIKKLGIAFNSLNGYMKVNGGSDEMRRLQTEIQGAIQKMRQLMNAGDYSGAIKSFENVSGIIRQATNATNAYDRAKKQAANSVNQLSDAEQRLAHAIKGSTDSMRGQVNVLADLKTMATQYLGVWGAQQFMQNIIQIGGQLEQQRLSIGAILGDMAAGQHLFDQIKQLALTSPFGVMELDKDTKQLSAYGFKQSELFDMTKRLADISAGAGTEVSRLALALGHVRSEGALTGYTLRQFAMNNIPMLQKLSERLTKIEGQIVSTSEIRKRVSKKEIGYEDVIAVIKDLTNEGGMFFNMQETMAEAVNAKFKNLKDSMDIMYGEMAEGGIGSALKKVAESLMFLTRNWEETARVVGYGTAAFIAYRVAVASANTQLMTYGSTVGITSRTLNAKAIALGVNTSAVRRLTASEVYEMVTMKLLTREQLLNAVATKKLTVDQAELAAATFGVTRAELTSIATKGKLGLATTGLGLRLRSLALSIRGVGVALKSMLLNPVGLTLMAITGAFEVFMRWKQRNEEIAQSIDQLGKKGSEGYKNLAATMEKYSGKEGKMSESEYSTAISDIIDQLKNYAPNIHNIQEEAQSIDSLAERYKYLRDELESTKNAYADLERTKSFASNANEATGNMLNDTFTENVEDYISNVQKVDKAEQELMQHRIALEKTLDELEKKTAFKRRTDENGNVMSLVEQLKYIRSTDWNKVFSPMLYSNSQGASAALSAYSSALTQMEERMRNEVMPDLQNFANRLNNDYASTFGKNWKENADHVKTAWMAVVSEIDKVPGMTDNVKRELLEKIFNETWHMNIDFSTGEITESLTGWRKEMQDWLDANGLNFRIGFNDSREDIYKKAKAAQETAQTEMNNAGQVLIGIGFKLNNLPNELPAPLNTPWNQKNLEDYNEQKNVNDLWEKFQKHFNANWQTKQDKANNKKGKSEDKDARRLREIIKLYKDAYDWYNKYEKQVGSSSALTKVQEQFRPLFDQFKDQFKQELSLDSIPLYKENLESLLKEAEQLYKEPKHKNSYMVEAIKQIRDAINNVDYEELGRKQDEYLSKTKIQLDSLTRAWDTFNKVRDATGNVDLAIQLSGVTYNEGNQNLADALKDKIQRDLDEISAGLTIDLNVNLSDEDIQRKVEEAFDSMKPVQGDGESNEAYAKRYQSRIKGIVEEYQKWRDLQRDVEQRDMDTFGKLIGSAVDLQTQVMKINDEYNELIASLDRLRSNGKLSDAQYGRAKGIADANTNMKLVQATAEYQMLMDGVVTMSKKAAQSIKNDYVNALERQFKAGTITAKDYADGIENVNDKMREMEKNQMSDSFFSGFSDMIENMRKRGKSDIIRGKQLQEEGQGKVDANSLNGDFNEYMKGIHMLNEGGQMAELGQGMMDMAGDMQTTTTIIDKIIHGINNVVQGLKNIQDEFDEMFDALGENDTTDEFHTFINSFSAASGKATQGWDSLKNGDVMGAIGGVIGSFTEWVTGFAKGHDAKRDRQIQLAEEQLKVLKNMDSRLDKSISRTLGGGMKAEIDPKSLQRFVEMDELATGLRSEDGQIQAHSFMKLVFGKYANVSAGVETLEAISDAVKNMSAYSAKYASLLEQRDEVERQLANEKDKKHSSSEAIDEYEQKLFELEDQITHFVEDTAKELWDLDLKGWASQIGDALMTAFENGEDAAKAFEETAKDIMRSVAGNMLKLGIIEPMMEQLRNELFSAERTDSNGNKWKGVYNVTTGRFDEQATLETLGKYFGKGGELEKTAEAGKQFYDWVEKISGIDLSADDSQNATANTIKGITEQTADLIASYVNAIRADVSVNRAMIAQYFPMYYNAMTSGNASLANIENHTAAIMRSNDTIAQKITNLDNNINGLKNKTWKVPMA